MDELERIKQLAGVDKEPSMGENLSYTGTKKAEYQRKRKEIAKKFGVESCSALKDEKERKACYAALDAAHVSDDEEKENQQKNQAMIVIWK